MAQFKDFFSGQASEYAAYRPRYPGEYFHFLSTLVDAHDIAWDCATGNGQAAIGLTSHFTRVIATDASKDQLAGAKPHQQIAYLLSLAENTPIGARTVDLITIAQALHWLQFESFYHEVRRVLKPGGVIAANAYGWSEITHDIDLIIRHFADEVVGPFWPPERRYVDEEYRTIPFPFDAIGHPPFTMEEEWTLDEFLGYLGTWSAAQRYRKHHHADPISAIRSALASAWGDPGRRRSVRWPLYIRIGRIARS